MNVQRWLKARRPSWERLDELISLIESQGGLSLSRQQLQELGRLYRCASADLSRARALKLGQDTQTYLNNLVVKAHNQVYQTRKDHWRDLGKFLWVQFPALVRRHMVYVALALAVFIIPGCIGYVYVQQDVHFAQLEMMKGHPLISDDIWHAIEQRKMWTDNLEKVSPVLSTLIATNNIRVAIMAFALGITFGFGTLFVLFMNGISTGTILGACHLYRMDDKLLAFVAPHGVLELSAVFICGGAGLLIGKAMLFPGQWRRIDALKLAARDALWMFGGCVPLLMVAGLIEGFISPRTDLGPNAKYLVSIATMFCLSVYLFAPRSSNADEGSSESRLK
jgi:uncharacterized membrane protein SpoIIM required for sporulation